MRMTVSDSGTPMVMGDGFGSGGFIWAFLIFALLMGNGGFGFGNGNGNSNAIQNDINRGFDNQNLQAQTRDILSAVTNGTAQSVAASNQVYHDLANNFSDKYSELQRDIANVSVGQANILANQNQCCCNTRLEMSEGFGQTRFDNAMNTASINAVTTAQTQKILDALAQNKIESLQNKVNYLETQNLLGNVVRYPTSSTYNAGNSPFCNCGNYNGYPYYA